MTDPSAELEPPRPDRIRRSLRALADGSAPACDPTEETPASDTSAASPEAVVEHAERAADSAREAASFLSAGRLPELGRAITTAARRGDDDLAARGRAAREPLRRLDDVMRGSDPTAHAVDDDAITSTPVAERF